MRQKKGLGSRAALLAPLWAVREQKRLSILVLSIFFLPVIFHHQALSTAAGQKTSGFLCCGIGLDSACLRCRVSE